MSSLDTGNLILKKYILSIKAELLSLNESELIHLDSEFKDYKELYLYEK